MEDGGDEETQDELASAYRVRLAEGGRVIIPARVRTRLGLAEGDVLIGEVADDGIVCKRWDGTEEELECRDLAREIAAAFDRVSDGHRDTLTRILADDHGLAVSFAGSQA